MTGGSRPHDAARPLVCLDETSKQLSDVHFPNADTIVLVQDNLNTHAPASLYKAFPPDEARRIAERFEWHYTPGHDSLARSFHLRNVTYRTLVGGCRQGRIGPQGLTDNTGSVRLPGHLALGFHDVAAFGQLIIG